MIQRAIVAVQRALRDYVSRKESSGCQVYTKILSHLVNSWVEVRLLKLVYELGAFSDDEKKRIIGRGSLEDKWQTALNLAFCKAYKISSPRRINSPSIPFIARTQWQALSNLLKHDLLESNELRNRIAHGQWKYAFNSDLLGINGKLTKELGNENILKIQYRLAMFKSLAQIIHDLAISKPTFERDFNNNYRIVEEQKRNSQNSNYEDYVRRMVEKRRRGIAKKQSRIVKKAVGATRKVVGDRKKWLW